MEKQNMRTFLLDAVFGVGFSGYSFRGGGIKSSFSRENNYSRKTYRTVERACPAV